MVFFILSIPFVLAIKTNFTKVFDPVTYDLIAVRFNHSHQASEYMFWNSGLVISQQRFTFPCNPYLCCIGIGFSL